MIDCEIRVLSSPDGNLVKIPGPNAGLGLPERGRIRENWRRKLRSRSEMLQYLEYNERYFYGQAGAYGSEKRHHPA